MNAWRIVLLVFSLTFVFIAALFTIQNGGRLSGLSLSFGISGAAFQLADPLPVPWLMWISLAVGLLSSGGWGLWQRFTLGKQISELQRKLDRASINSGNDPWKS